MTGVQTCALPISQKESQRVQAQNNQSRERLKLDALKVLATPKQPKVPPAPGRKE